MLKEAIILAGGFGTRLRQVISDVPKPMADIGGRPFLEYLLIQLQKAGYDHVVISTGYLSGIIEAHIGSCWRGLDISYAVETEPLGTGGGVMNALTRISSREVTVMNGDSFLALDLDSFLRTHLGNGADISIALASVGDVRRYGSVSLASDNRIQGFNEKGTASGAGVINGGIYLLHTETMRTRFPVKRFSLEKDVFENASDLALYGYECGGYFIDIGVPADYARAAEELPKLFAPQT